MGVCWKYDSNFWKVEACDVLNHCTFVEHECAIHLINERCTCGKVDVDSKSLNYKTPVSSPLPIGTPMLPEPVPLQVVPHFQVLEESWCLLLVRLTISQLRCDCSQKRYLFPIVLSVLQYVVKGLCLLLEPPQRRGPAARGFVEMPRTPPRQGRGSNK